MSSEGTILCIGEVLWDVFPTGEFLGGAPMNVAYHLHALGQPALIASRIGRDELGERTLERMSQLGLSPTLVQQDPSLPTGRVLVDLTEPSAPRYDIHHPAAWDAIEFSPDLQSVARQARAIVFGSLAQRDDESRKTIRDALDTAPATALRVFDINLRPPYDKPGVVADGLQFTDLLKLNDVELDVLRGWFQLPAGDKQAVEALAKRFECPSICVTRGDKGATLLHEGEHYQSAGYRVKLADPVGAGDAFLAALLNGLLQSHEPAASLDEACALGAFVASQPSATPRHDRERIEAIRRSQ